MGRSIPNVRFELNQVYRTYSDQLQLAGNISDFLLVSANINSAGGQVEGSLRVLLKELLPERVTVTHGHIVDRNTKVSNQQDVLLSESFFTKSLIKTLDGTEFYPYESIFAAGEVKKKWSQKKLIQAIGSIRRNKCELERNRIPADQLATGSTFIKLSHPVTSNLYRNPLFSFTFALDYDNEYKEEKFIEIYNDPLHQHYLPNISVVLNRGIYVLVDEEKLNENIISIKLYPEFVHPEANCKWTLLKLNPEENLAFLIFMLTQHINDTILEKASAMSYAHKMIEIPETSIYPL